MSWVLMAKVLAETAKITFPTALEGALRRGGQLELYDARLAAWSANMLDVADVDLEVSGREHLGRGEAFVVMSNHQSHYDIPVVFQALKRRMRMVAKTELFRIPLFGRAMHVAGFVEVDRSNRDQAMHALEGARRAVAAGTNIWIAPEGTRSESGHLAPFKKGGFHLALGAHARILPVSIDGTKDVLPAHSRTITRGQHVRVVVSPPIDPADYGHDKLDALMQAVRDAIAAPIPYA
ncbi:MAG: lysophospholipid acyltransferase family protein [Polyangiaceae bacterium]